VVVWPDDVTLFDCTGIATRRVLTMTNASSEPVRSGDARIWIDENGTMRVQFDAASFADLVCAKENVAVAHELAGDRKLPVFVDLRRIKGATREARAYYTSGESTAFIAALALLVDSPVSRVLGNFVVGLGDRSYPARVFTDQAEALEWVTGTLR
jgi:hypothetical protein